MNIPLGKEFIGICNEILEQNKSEQQWAEIESGDIFQTEMFCGGFDADENEFCFSYYSLNGNEYWFQLGLTIVEKISGGISVKIRGTISK